MTGRRRTLAINLGGTTVKWAVPGSGGERLRIGSMPSPQRPETFTGMLRTIARDIGGAPDVVSFGFPGPIDPAGRPMAAPTLWPTVDMRGFDLRGHILSAFPSSQVHVINDVSAYGAFIMAKGLTDFCVLNLGSGVGSKIYVGGQEVTGPSGRGGEIGHWRDAAAGADLPCDCGGSGHVGALSSGRGVQRFAVWRARQDPTGYAASVLGRQVPDPDDLTSQNVAEAIRAGDYFALAVLEEAMAPLGRAVALLHVALGCERFFLVGGFAEAVADRLPGVLSAVAARHCWPNEFAWESAFYVLEDEVRLSLLGLVYHADQAGPKPACV